MLQVAELYQLDHTQKRKTILQLNSKLAAILENSEKFKIKENVKTSIENLKKESYNALASDQAADKWLQQASIVFKITKIDPETIVSDARANSQGEQMIERPKKISQPLIIQQDVFNLDKPEKLDQAVELLIEHIGVLDAHFNFVEYLVKHPNPSNLLKQLIDLTEEISTDNFETNEQKKLFDSLMEGKLIVQMLCEKKIDLEKLSIYKNIICLTPYWNDELNGNQLIGLFEFQKNGLMGTGFVKAIKSALSRNQKLAENQLNVLDMQVLSKFNFNTPAQLVSYNLFINKLMKFL